MTYEFDRNTDLQDDVLAQDVNELQVALEGHEFLTLKAATEITVASGVLVLTQACHKIQPESGTVDDIDTISGLDAGDIAVLYISDKGTNTLTFKHGTGNISCPGGLDASISEGVIIAYYDGTFVYISLGAGGGGGGVTDHGALTGLEDDDHPQYILHSLATAANDFLVGGGSSSWVKKTLSEVLTILGKAAASGLASLNASSKVVQDPANAQTTAAASKIPIADSSGKLDTWLSDASETVKGKVKLATTSEINTGTDNAKAITPDGLAGSVFGKKIFEGMVTAPGADISTGDGKVYFLVTEEFNNMDIKNLLFSVKTKSTSGAIQVQIARGRQSSPTSDYSWVDVLTTVLSIDQDEYCSKDAATPHVINSSNDDLATGDLIRIDIDAAGTGADTLIGAISAGLP